MVRAPEDRPAAGVAASGGELMAAPAAQAQLRRFAHSSLSAQAMGPGYLYAALGAAVLPFVRVGGWRLAAGPPVLCGAGDGQHAAKTFVRHAAQGGLGAAFFGVTAAWAQRLGYGFVPLGEEMLLHPGPWMAHNRRERSIAAQLRRAAKRGVTVARTTLDGRSRAELQTGALAAHTAAWQARHAMPAMAFVAALRPSRRGVGQELWLASRAGAWVAFAVVLPIGRRGWLIEHIVRHPRAPNGTAELLIDAIVRGHADADEISLGLAPLAGKLPRPLRWARRLGGPWYSFAGLEAFKSKLGPHEKRPLGLAVAGRGGRLAACGAVVAMLRAFAGGSFVRFAVRLLARGPTPVLVAMAALLPLWMWGLWALPTAAWFVAPWVQQAWLLFDAVLCVLLWATLRAPSFVRLRLLAWVVTLDGGVTLMQALLYPGPKHLMGLALHVLGVAAPSISAVMLWGASIRARARRWPA